MSVSAPTPQVLAHWRNARAVCFDVDSTVSPDEGIDVLAAVAGKLDQVAALTRRAMGGAVRFEQALRERLDLLRPSRGLIDRCLREHPPRLTPGIAALVARLHDRGSAVHLVSGGFHDLIDPLAHLLGIPGERVHANRLRFAADGSYAGYDVEAPTSRSGGKAVVLADLKRRFGYSPLVMIGDGVTDLEARPPADCFIGFGGVAVREAVERGADWFVRGFDVLLAAL